MGLVSRRAVSGQGIGRMGQRLPRVHSFQASAPDYRCSYCHYSQQVTALDHGPDDSCRGAACAGTRPRFAGEDTGRRDSHDRNGDHCLNCRPAVSCSSGNEPGSAAGFSRGGRGGDRPGGSKHRSRHVERHPVFDRGPVQRGRYGACCGSGGSGRSHDAAQDDGARWRTERCT